MFPRNKSFLQFITKLSNPQKSDSKSILFIVSSRSALPSVYPLEYSHRPSWTKQLVNNHKNIMCALQKHPVSWLHLQLPQHDAAFLTFCFYTSTISKWLKLSWWPCWCFSLKKEQPFVMDCHQGMRDSQADRFQVALMGDTRPRWTPELRSSTGFSSQENTKSFALHQGLLTQRASRKL